MSKNELLQQEFENLCRYNLPVEGYRNKTFLITGATGLIGSLLVQGLLFLNEKYNLGLSVIAGIRNKKKADVLYGILIPDAPLSFLEIDFESSNNVTCDGAVDFLIHTAAITQSKQMVSNPVGTITVSVCGTEQMLKLAVEKNSTMVYLSSMEVYGKPTINKVKESDLGYIDLTNPRSCYPESKRMCEMLCTAYYSQYGLNVKIARLAQTFGVGVLPSENRVFMQFARSVIESKDIVLHTSGGSEGNYVYTIDAVAGLLLLLTKGEAGQSYNINNEESHTTIKEMAEMVCRKIANGRIKTFIEIPSEEMGYAPDVKIWLDNSKMKNLGWTPIVGLEESYKRMIQWIQE